MSKELEKEIENEWRNFSKEKCEKMMDEIPISITVDYRQQTVNIFINIDFLQNLTFSKDGLYRKITLYRLLIPITIQEKNLQKSNAKMHLLYPRKIFSVKPRSTDHKQDL